MVGALLPVRIETAPSAAIAAAAEGDHVIGSGTQAAGEARVGRCIDGAPIAPAASAGVGVGGSSVGAVGAVGAIVVPPCSLFVLAVGRR